MPRILNIVGFHTVFKCGIYFTLEYFFSPLFISCVSSANWDILCSTLFIQIPLISLSSRIMITKISTHKINMYGDIGSPCRHPRSSVNHWVVCPLTITVDVMFLYIKKSIYPSTKVFSKTEYSKSPKHEPPVKSQTLSQSRGIATIQAYFLYSNSLSSHKSTERYHPCICWK